MRVTTSQLRQIAMNPTVFVRNARQTATSERQFGNPQRSWMESAWKAYFETNRNQSALWSTFDRKVGDSRTVTTRRRSLARGAVPMLELFLAWDGSELATPSAWFLPSSDVVWQGHTLSLKRDALYLTETGYRVRQIWTDTQTRIDNPDIGLLIAGVLVYSDADLGFGRVERVDVWQLRAAKRRSWSREQLDSEVLRLKERLDEVEFSLSKSI